MESSPKYATASPREEKLVFQIEQAQPRPTEAKWCTRPDGAVSIHYGKGPLASSAPMTVHSLVAQSVKDAPHFPALRYQPDPKQEDWNTITMLEYYQMACRAAKSFIKLGVKRYHSVGILGFNSVEWFVADLGAIFAGGFACGIYTTNSAETCQFVASDSRCVVIVVESKALMDKILSIRDKLPDLQAIIQYKGEPECKTDRMLYSWTKFMELGDEVPDSELIERLTDQAPNECCTLIYTSGTTGNPKGVMLSHDNLTWTTRWLSQWIPMQKFQECTISYLPLSHIAAQIADLYLPLFIHGTLHFAQPDALKGSLGKTLKQVRPTFFLGVPRVWEKMQEKMMEIGASITGIRKVISVWAKSVGHKAGMAKMNGESMPWNYSLASTLVFNNVKKALGFDRCQFFASAAAPISKETILYFLSLDIPLMEVYGMSECSGPQCCDIPSAFRVGSVGKVIKEGEMHLDNPDEDGNGEVCMRGRHVFMGYLNAEEKTKETIDEERWLHSGDIGRLDEGDFLSITGRIKELLITAGGENVAPIPVEERVRERLPIVSNCMLIGDKKKFLSMLITLKCELDPETAAPKDELTPAAIAWCHSIGYTATTVSEIIEQQPESLFKAIQAGIDAANKAAISNASTIQKWTIVPRDFSVYGGELGPTLKLRRPIVNKMYEELIDGLYEC